jgi:hypothetical protein
LFRLQTSFSAACLLLKQYRWVELACIEKLIFEQICWSYCVRHLQGDALYKVTPTNSVKGFKNIYPQPGWVYGHLNRIAHISPRQSIEYLDFSGTNKPGIVLSSAKHCAKCGFLLLFLVDMFQVCSEYVYSDYYKKFFYTKRASDGGLHLNPKRKTKAATLRFQTRLRIVERS